MLFPTRENCQNRKSSYTSQEATQSKENLRVSQSQWECDETRRQEIKKETTYHHSTGAECEWEGVYILADTISGKMEHRLRI